MGGLLDRLKLQLAEVRRSSSIDAGPV